MTFKLVVALTALLDSGCIVQQRIKDHDPDEPDVQRVLTVTYPNGMRTEFDFILDGDIIRAQKFFELADAFREVHNLHLQYGITTLTEVLTSA